MTLAEVLQRPTHKARSAMFDRRIEDFVQSEFGSVCQKKGRAIIGFWQNVARQVGICDVAIEGEVRTIELNKRKLQYRVTTTPDSVILEAADEEKLGGYPVAKLTFRFSGGDRQKLNNLEVEHTGSVSGGKLLESRFDLVDDYLVRAEQIVEPDTFFMAQSFLKQGYIFNFRPRSALSSRLGILSAVDLIDRNGNNLGARKIGREEDPQSILRHVHSVARFQLVDLHGLL